MTTKQIAGQTIELDADNHMKNPEAWNETIAQAFAQEEGIPQLTDRHWKVIHFMRDDYKTTNTSATVRRITTNSGVETKELYALFPKGPAKKAAKIAGLPKPKGCI